MSVTILIQDKLFGFFSIYATNPTANRFIVWEWMASSLPTMKSTIGGDLNMVEQASNKDGGVGSVISSLEKQAWS